MALDVLTIFDSPITAQTDVYKTLKRDAGLGLIRFKYTHYRFGNGGAFPNAQTLRTFEDIPPQLINPVTYFLPFFDADILIEENQTLLILKLKPEDLSVETKVMISELSVYASISWVKEGEEYPYNVGDKIEIINIRFPAEYYDPSQVSSAFRKVIPIIGS